MQLSSNAQHESPRSVNHRLDLGSSSPPGSLTCCGSLSRAVPYHSPHSTAVEEVTNQHQQEHLNVDVE